MRPELVTVVIPCYNQGRFLGEAVESVLRQGHRGFEVVVVDDGSTDDTAEVAARYPEVRLVRQGNRGLAGARNRGLAAAWGEYLVFLDADDRLLPDALASGLRCLAAHPQAAFTYGRYLNISADGTPLSPSMRPCVGQEHYLHLLQSNYIGMHAAVMYRRWVLGEVGGFDERLKACEDYDIYFRIARRFPIHCHPELTAEYRQHDANMTRDLALMVKSALDVLHSQWPHVRGKKRYEGAFETGVGFWQSYFGEELLDDVIASARARDAWKSIVRGGMVLARYYPAGIIKRVGRKVKRALVYRKGTASKLKSESY